MELRELDEHIRRHERSVRVLKRLYFIRFLYYGYSVEEASKHVGVTKAVGYIWLKRWNQEGYSGLIPRFGGGRPPKLNYKDREKLRELLKERDSWTISEVQELILKEFGVEYSYWQVRRILKSFGMHHSKPYPKDYRRPENAEEILKKD
jgi:putative transposase